MALAQDTDLLLLDEPTTYLDLSHQIEVLDLVRNLNQRRGRTIVMVLHDLNLAARYSDRLVAMRDGAARRRRQPGRRAHRRRCCARRSASTRRSCTTRSAVARW